MNSNGILAICLLVGLMGCASQPKEVEPEKLKELISLEKEVLAQLDKESPEATKELEKAIGYAIIEQKIVKVPVVGAGGGKGVVVDKATDKRTYLKVKRIDLGLGWGGKAYKLIMIIHDKDVLRDLETGKFGVKAGAEATAKAGDVGGGGGEGVSLRDKGYTTYTLTDAGVSATVTIRVFSARPYTPS